MQTAETPAPEPKKPGSTRARKGTPRSRSRKNSDDKKPPTRRRASPRTPREKTPVKPPEKEDEAQKETPKQDEETSDDKRETETANEPVAKQELLPAEDGELRRTYLHRVYRQLQSTHPSQDDTIVRQTATTLEMEICRTATNKDEYVTAMEQEINKLMQFEMAQVNTPTRSNEPQSFEGHSADAQPQPAVTSELQNEHAQVQQMTQSRHFEYAQALAKAQAQSDGGGSMMSTPRQSMSGGDGAYAQAAVASQNVNYYHSMQQQEQHQQNAATQGVYMQMGNQYYSTPTSMAVSSQSFSTPTNAGEMNGINTPRTMMEAQQQLGSFQFVHQQQASSMSQQRAATLQEFTAQVQHFDKSVLIELLWNQRNSLAQWQHRANQLETELTSQRNASSNMGSPGFPSPYGSPMLGSPYASSNLSTEAELQRARERSSARVSQQTPQYSYNQPYSDSNAAVSSQNTGATWGTNPQLYWEKIRVMKAAHSGQLMVAHRALAQHTAPPNTVHGMKAQSVKNNILLVLNVLNEPPKATQPRPFEVLSTIERFIQGTVIPIVRKVQSSGTPSSTGSMTPRGYAPVATNVATYAPGLPSARDSSPAVASYPTGTNTQYSGPRWASQASQFNGGESSQQVSHEEVATNQGMDQSGQAGDEMPGENYQSNRTDVEYEAVKASSSVPGSHSQNFAVEESSGARIPSATCRSSASDPSTASSNNTSDKMVAPSVEDSLNDFSDFPELDFDDQLPGTNFVKENNSSNMPRKRGIEDV